MSLLHFYIFTLKNPFYFTPNYSGYCCVASFLAAGYIYISKAVKRERESGLGLTSPLADLVVDLLLVQGAEAVVYGLMPPYLRFSWSYSNQL